MEGTREVLPGDDAKLESELQTLVEKANASGEKIRHYIGYEISGQVHIGSGIASALKIKQLTDCGVECHIWLADYHTWINNKLDGTLATARKVAREYFGAVMLKCMQTVGCDMDLVKVVYAEQEYEKSSVSKNSANPRPIPFFEFDLMVAKNLTLSRVLKSISITGKKDGDAVEFATLRYPPMQVADAFFLNTHIVHAGMDQRKAHVLMREVASKLDDDYALTIGGQSVAPIAVHHDLLLSLSKPARDGSQERMRDEMYEDNKMSKSKPDSAVFVHDSPEEIRRKIKNAYCPMIDTNLSQEENQEIQQFNPLLDWSKKMIFAGGKTIEISRPEKFGGYIKFENYTELEQAYFGGNLHPMDLKTGVAETLINWFEPIRKFVEENPEGLELVRGVRK